jgi:hypothetical protein
MYLLHVQGWRVASDRVPDEFYVVQNLHPGTAYRFLIRAYNSHGLSQPSNVAGPIRTTGILLMYTVLYILFFKVCKCD